MTERNTNAFKNPKLEELWYENTVGLERILCLCRNQAERDEAYANYKTMADILSEVADTSPELQERFIKTWVRDRRFLKVKLLVRSLLMRTGLLKTKLHVINLSGF